MSFFAWSAPIFHRVLDRRWAGDDVSAIAARLRPYVPPGGALLDVGGGTGALASRLAGALHAQVAVLDPTPEMLAYVPAHPALEATLGVAENMPYRDGAFDAVLISDAFHHFRDQDRAVREIVRVVRPGGGVKPDRLCTFLAARRLNGECRAERGASYSFLGTV